MRIGAEKSQIVSGASLSFMGLSAELSIRSELQIKFFSQPGPPEKFSSRGKIKSSWTGSSMVEQLTLNQRVVGSSPTRFTTLLLQVIVFPSVYSSPRRRRRCRVESN